MAILETNQWRRPIYFAPWGPMGMDIDSCVQDCGLVQRLLPVRVARYGLETDTATIKRVLLDSMSYRDVATYKDHPMPRASGILYGYATALLDAAPLYAEAGDSVGYNRAMDQLMALGPKFFEQVNPDYAKQMREFRSGSGTAADPAAVVNDSVMFRTSEPAPADFDRWTFFWAHPSVAESAQVGFQVRSGQGEAYYDHRWGPHALTPGDSSRSDFWFGQTNPRLLYGKDIIVKFLTDKGKLEFPAGFTPFFEFYKKSRTVKRIEGIRASR